MTERPILFSTPMVQAILAGRKTQTRRLLNPQPVHAQHHIWKGKVVRDAEHRMWCYRDRCFDNIMNFGPMYEDNVALAAMCPKGKLGDRLWVRETFCEPSLHSDLLNFNLADKVGDIEYAADMGTERFPVGGNFTPQLNDFRWRPSIHMPRYASRITLEVTGVRVERLQAITEADAAAEGWQKRPELSSDPEVHRDAARDWFMDLWYDIHGKGSWDANPWVWVISFRRLEMPNV